jgi:glycosyltransferase involved in cell wall biosynthesis
LSRVVPALDRALAARAVPDVPRDLVYAHWGWEWPRVIAGRLPHAERLEDWLWHRAEDALDRRAAALLARPEVQAFLGVEYGALAALRTARQLDKPGVVAFLSPHPRTRAKWVDAEFDRQPDVTSPRRAALERLAPARDARRDEEAAVARWIETGSSFTTRSLIEAGIPASKVLTVPLGGPPPIDARRLPTETSGPLRVIYAGPVSVRKGAHYLLRAWRRVSGGGAELHFYGKPLLSPSLLREAQGRSNGDSIVFHGSVPPGDLVDAYLSADVLVLPTLCDGFGMVVSEALAHGLPAITTTNAGAADIIDHGVTGFVIPPANEDAIAGVLQWCLDHRGDLLDMRPAALAAAARWTWDAFRRRHWEVWSVALGRAAMPSERVGIGA